MWVFLALLASAMTGGATIANKYVFARVSDSPMVQTICGGLVGLLLSMVMSYAHGFGRLGGVHMLLAMLSGVCFGLSLLLILSAVRLGNVSRVGPLRFLAPIFVAVLATLFLRETLHFTGYLGIALIVVGAIYMENTKLSALRLDKCIVFMLGSCMMLAVSQILSKYLLQFSDPVTILVYVRMGLLLFILPLLVVYWKTVYQAIQPRPFKNVLLLAIGGAFGTMAMLLVICAASEGPISAVSVLSSLAPIFILLYIMPMNRRFPDIYTDKISSQQLAQKAFLTLVMFAGVTLIIVKG